MDKILIVNASELVTCSGFEAKCGKEAMNDLGIIQNGAIAMADGIITHVGTTEEVLSQINEDEYAIIDAENKAVLPGFVDSHTHFVFGGYREDEYDWRLRGLSYVEIMERGGGIINSVRGTEEASLEELVELGLKRLDSILSFGVTTVEGKSGYGLYKETELKQLEALQLCDEQHVVDVVKTFLGAHSVPKEYKGRSGEFIDYLIEEVLPIVAEENLAEFCDIFCEDKVFSVEESRKLLTEAKKMGLKLKLHADEIVPLGGAGLAAELHATSADHLLVASDEDILKMAEAKVVATCLPCTAFSLKEPYARARFMVDSGCAVAVASDFNPGSCHTESIPLAIALSTLYMGLTTEETITALTINGAAALDRADTIGSLDVGKKADIVIHEFPSYKFLPYHIGVSTVEVVIKNGEVAFVK
ncbi:MAG: imidazolonepropionase [Clostridia bacterium]|nr:imidazolonepropionase [Clostridia bacterium]